MPDATWKAVERRVARALGGRRVGNTGRDTPDVDAGWLVAEVKHRRTLPRWILEALARARQQAGSARLGVAVLHEHQAHDSLVVMSLADFREWFVEGSGGRARTRRTHRKEQTKSKQISGGRTASERGESRSRIRLPGSGSGRSRLWSRRPGCIWSECPDGGLRIWSI